MSAFPTDPDESGSPTHDKPMPTLQVSEQTYNSQHRPSASAAAAKATADRKSKADREEEKKFIDEFGFELDENEMSLETQFVRSVDGEQVARREVKWTRMAAEWSKTLEKTSDKLKERARKGIPTKLRGIVWQLLTGSRVQMESPENQTVYLQLQRKKIPDDTEGLIERDLARTFPRHESFKDVDGAGQKQLRNILHSYAVIDPEVGYVQGMGFIVGTLLTQMSEQEAFWCFHALMHSEVYRLRELYKPGFPMLQMFFYQLKRLMQKLTPKLAAHLDTLGIDLSFFAAQWFLTIFVYHFQFRALLRVWDIFFCEGWKIVFRVAIALMKWEEANLLQMTFDQILPRMKTLHEGKACDDILNRSLKVKFKTEELLEFRREYESGLR